MSSNINSSLIKQWALEEGFSLVGIAPAEPIATAEYLQRYLDRGYHGTMDYIPRNAAKRIDPRKALDGARSIICLAVNYYNPAPPDHEPDTSGLYGRIARYAWGRDYHKTLKRYLGKLRDRIAGAVGQRRQFCCFDSGPLAEKAHAARAGLGWIGKNGLLINERFGSWLVLGEIVTDLELDYDEPASDRCGDCARCLKACPTTALIEPRILDARRCVSYLTAESEAEASAELAAKMGDWLLGCDVCQEVCPFNKDTPATKEPDFDIRRCRLALEEIFAMDIEQFKQRFAGTALVRTKWQHIQQTARNCQKNLTTP